MSNHNNNIPKDYKPAEAKAEQSLVGAIIGDAKSAKAYNKPKNEPGAATTSAVISHVGGSTFSKKNRIFVFATLAVLVLVSSGWLVFNKSSKDTLEVEGVVQPTKEQLQQTVENKQQIVQSDATSGNSTLVGNSPQETSTKIAAQLGPLSAETVVQYIDLADFQLTNNLYDDAIKTYTAALSSATTNEQKMVIYVGIGEAYKALGNTNSAKANYQLAYNQVAAGDASYDAMKSDLQERINAL